MVYHLSHNDLDGYGAQLITNTIFKNDIQFFNSGYGKQIDENLTEIFKTITEKDMLLLTDLNLTMEQADKLNLYADMKGFQLLLIDHHETGKPCANKYDWYHLDITKSATKLTYDFFTQEVYKSNRLANIVKIINANDLWLMEDENLLEQGKSLSQNLFDCKNEFPKVLKNLEPKFLIYMINKLGFLHTVGVSIPEVEGQVYNLKRNYFDPNQKSLLPFHVLKIHYMYEFILKSDLYINIEIENKKGVLFYGLSSIFQEFSHIYLNKTDIDFVANISEQGRISFRTTKDNVSVSEISKKYFKGGGHQKASGGSIPDTNNKKLSKEEAFELFQKQY